MAGKTSSKELASLASRVLTGYEPSGDELKSLAASVLAQAEPDGAEAGTDQASPDIPEPSVSPGPADIVTVTVSKTGYETAIERGVVSDHPDTRARLHVEQLNREAEAILDDAGW